MMEDLTCRRRLNAVLWRAQFMQTPLSGARLEVFRTAPESLLIAIQSHSTA